MSEEIETPDCSASVLAFMGGELRRHRVSAGLTQGEVARQALATQAMVSYVETGKRVPSETLAHDFDRVFATDGFFARLYPLVLRHAYPSWLLPYVRLEQDARSIRVWQVRTVPGLLQTEEYARLVFRAARPDRTDDLVAARMSRQAVFERETPPYTWFVLAESALSGFRQDGGVMRAQLDRLLRLGDRPRVVIQVLPCDAPAHPGLTGSFTLLDLPEGESVLYADAFHRGRMGVEPEELAAADRAYDLLRALALPPEDSRDLIRSSLRHLDVVHV